MVDALVDGRIIGELGREGEPQLDVVIRANGQGVHDKRELLAAPVATPTGRVVPLGTLATVDDTVGPASISRIERRRSITLQVSPPDDMALETTMQTIAEQVVEPLRAEGLPDGVRIDLAGTAGKLGEARGRMLGVLGLAVVISFALLAALFEDFLAPVVVLVTVPLAAAGGVAGLRLVDATLGSQPLDMMTAVGFVILIGVVVNNAILVVDGALGRLRAGMDLPTSLGEAVSRRVRPIFMATLTSLAGLLPLVLFPGSGSELYRGVGAVVLGGLALSTVLTLFVVPPLFGVMWKLGGARDRAGGGPGPGDGPGRGPGAGDDGVPGGGAGPGCRGHRAGGGAGGARGQPAGGGGVRERGDRGGAHAVGVRAAHRGPAGGGGERAVGARESFRLERRFRGAADCGGPGRPAGLDPGDRAPGRHRRVRYRAGGRGGPGGPRPSPGGRDVGSRRGALPGGCRAPAPVRPGAGGGRRGAGPGRAGVGAGVGGGDVHRAAEPGGGGGGRPLRSAGPHGPTRRPVRASTRR